MEPEEEEKVEILLDVFDLLEGLAAFLILLEVELMETEVWDLGVF